MKVLLCYNDSVEAKAKNNPISGLFFYGGLYEQNTGFRHVLFTKDVKYGIM